MHDAEILKSPGVSSESERNVVVVSRMDGIGCDGGGWRRGRREGGEKTHGGIWRSDL